MARAPSKRRGITLGPRAGSAASLEGLSAQMSAPASSAQDRASSAVEPTDKELGPYSELLLERIESLRRWNAVLESRWLQQAEELQTQMRQMEAQREEIALQARQLQTFVQARRTSRRLGLLLSLLCLVGVGALVFHTWPRLQGLASDIRQVNLRVGRLAPQVQVLRGDVTALNADLGRVASNMESLRQDVSQVRSELGSLRQAVDTPPGGKGQVQADTGGRWGLAQTSPRAATTTGNPYRGVRPIMPW